MVESESRHLELLTRTRVRATIRSTTTVYTTQIACRRKAQRHNVVTNKIFDRILPQLRSATTTTLWPYFLIHWSTYSTIFFNLRSIASRCFCERICASGSELVDSCKTSLSFLSFWLSRAFILCHVERRILKGGRKNTTFWHALCTELNIPGTRGRLYKTLNHFLITVL
jgi:hypothetical protein